MQPFTKYSSVAAPYFFPDVDTDKIIPHVFLRKPLSAGYRNFLFYNLRFTPEGKTKSFILHEPPFNKAGILISGANFGCGSTREGAVYALTDFGFRAVIAPSFGDIFQANCLQNGLLPVVLAANVVEQLATYVSANPGATISIDLEDQSVTAPDGKVYKFPIDASRKEQLLKGLDDIGITLTDSKLIDDFEAAYKKKLAWL